MKKFLILFLIIISVYSHAQNEQNTYQYIIVPLQYDFTSKPNEFQLSVLTRMMLKEEGFKVYMSQDEALPEELAKDKCLALKANIIKDNGLLSTTMKFQLYNCFGNKVYESEGKSNLKAYKDAYQDALKKALVDFQLVSHSYLKKEGETEEQMVSDTAATINKVEEDIPFEDKAESYLNNNKSYWLLGEDENYTLYLDKGETVYATLQKADRGTYFFDSSEIDGAAYFNAKGDIILEYLSKNEETVQSLVFKKQ